MRVGTELSGQELQRVLVRTSQRLSDLVQIDNIGLDAIAFALDF